MNFVLIKKILINLFLNDCIRLRSCLRCLSLFIGLILITTEIASSKDDACFSVNVGF